MVQGVGIAPTTFCVASRRSAKLSYLCVSQTRALPVAPYPFEVQNTTRVLVFVPRGTLPCLQDPGIYTLSPLSCWAPSLSTAWMMSLSLPKEIGNPTPAWGFTSHPVRLNGACTSPHCFQGPPYAIACKQVLAGLATRIPIWDRSRISETATAFWTIGPT